MLGPSSLLSLCLSFSLYLASSSKIVKVDFAIQYDRYFTNNSDVKQAAARTLIQCANVCFKTSSCQYAAFNNQTGICNVANDSSHDAGTYEPGWIFIKVIMPASISCTDCVRYGSSWYNFVDIPLNMDKAKADCANLGGKLVEVETENENNFLKSRFYAIDSQEFGFWLGAYNVGPNYNFTWNSTPSEPMPFIDFAPLEPNGGRLVQEQCLAFEKAKLYFWMDVSCGQYGFRAMSYVCEFSV